MIIAMAAAKGNVNKGSTITEVISTHNYLLNKINLPYLQMYYTSNLFVLQLS